MNPMFITNCVSAASFLQKERIETFLEGAPGKAVISNPNVAWSLNKRDKQQLYPPWLEGTWQVRVCCRISGRNDQA